MIHDHDSGLFLIFMSLIMFYLIIAFYISNKFFDLHPMSAIITVTVPLLISGLILI